MGRNASRDGPLAGRVVRLMRHLEVSLLFPSQPQAWGLVVAPFQICGAASPSSPAILLHTTGRPLQVLFTQSIAINLLFSCIKFNVAGFYLYILFYISGLSAKSEI